MIVDPSLNSDVEELSRFTQELEGRGVGLLHNVLVNEIVANTVIHTGVEC